MCHMSAWHERVTHECVRLVQRPARPASPGRGKNPFSSAACLAYDANGMPLPAATGATVNSVLGTQDGGATVARTPPSPDSSLQERMGFVHWQLDQFTGSQLLLGKYKSLGPAARRQGGMLPPTPVCVLRPTALVLFSQVAA